MRSLLSRLLVLLTRCLRGPADREIPPMSASEYAWFELENPSYQSVQPVNNPFF